MTLDPIHQFNINNIFTIGHIGSHTIAFTNSSVYMLLTVAVICLFAVRGMKGRQLVPGRFQSAAELSYVFVATMIRSTAGEDGMKFFPLVYCIFMFILVANLISIIPYTFTVTSHIIVTAAFALLVFFTVLIYGFYKNGLKFFKIFVPPGVPMCRNRDHFLSVAAAVAQRTSVCQHAGRPHHAEGVCGFRRHARHFARRDWLGRRHGAAGIDRCADRPRTAGGVSAGLRVCDPDLHLSQRCASRRALRHTREPR
ncbi:hypothetical protein ACVWVY_001593 [Bradyrhizobium sp. URHC0002]